MFTPVQVLAKGFYAVFGIAFWVLPTVFRALPLEHLSRIPPPLGDVPSDAEFAMDIIGQRSARGDPVLPSSLRNKRKNRRGADAECSGAAANITSIDSATIGQVGGPYIDAGSGEIVSVIEDQSENGGEEERKKKAGLREKVSRGLIWVGEGRNMMEIQKRVFPGYNEHPEHLVKSEFFLFRPLVALIIPFSLRCGVSWVYGNADNNARHGTLHPCFELQR